MTKTKMKEQTPEGKMMDAIFGNKSKEEIQKMVEEEHPSEATVIFNNALDLIMDLVDGDSDELCGIVGEHYPGWCNENNCKNFNKTCLVKALKHYKKKD